MDFEEGAGESIDICMKYSYVFIRFCYYSVYMELVRMYLHVLLNYYPRCQRNISECTDPVRGFFSTSLVLPGYYAR